jgi:hypothetical protein
MFVGTCEGKSLFGKRRHRCEGNIKMDINEIGWEGVNWMNVGHYRNWCQAVVSAGTNDWVL